MAKLKERLSKKMPKPQVETFHVGHARGWIERALPSPLVTFYCILAAGSITSMALFLGDRFGGGKGYLWSMIAIGVMTLIGAIVGFFRNAKSKRAAQERSGKFQDALSNSTGGWDTSLSDVNEIARLDDLRGKFLEGVEVFRKHGKNLYELPWYVIVGEPGSGKSEAIRHSELRFPPGLQDKLQGVGGTYSMNWWFTNNAVMLDTAGAMLLQEEAVGRFQEFLRLLREHRTEFPINGLILTLPMDKLLTDAPHIAEEKARTIAKQLQVIQQALDVRFPLYLMISKSDRLTGFRDFFDAENQSAFELQMVGWSNPDPLEAPFDPARTQEALDCLADRLRSRALALLSDPLPRMDGRRRLDEVDSLYAFPEILRGLAPRIRCYLDTIFQTGAWAAKTPFFRGLYFTSALREGNQLDQALANALNIDVQKLSTGGLFTQEKSSFLRDLFLSKVFLERGLVSRMQDIVAMLRRRLLLFYGTVLTLILFALFFSFLVRDSLFKQLDGEQYNWEQANQTWDNGVLLSPLVRQPAPAGKPPTWVWNETGDPLKVHAEIATMTQKPLKYGWFFSGIRQWRAFEQRRKETGFGLIEASAMKPLLDAAREKILWDTAEGAVRDPATEERLAKAYRQLATLEAWVGPDRTATSSKLKVPAKAKDWQPFFEDLLAYVLNTDDKEKLKPAQALAELAGKTYGNPALLADRTWLSEDHLADQLGDDQRESTALFQAARLLFGETADKAAEAQAQRGELNEQKQALLKNFLDAEAKLKEASQQGIAPSREEIASTCMTPMQEAVAAYQTLLRGELGASVTTIDFQSVLSAAELTLEVIEISNPKPLRVYKENIRGITGESAQGAAPENTSDREWAAAVKRFDAYEKAFQPIGLDRAGISTKNLIGKLRITLEQAAKKTAVLAETGKQDAGGAKEGEPAPAEDGGTQQLAAFLKRYGGVSVAAGIFQVYQAQVLTDLKERLHFPLVRGGNVHPNQNAFLANCKRLKQIEQDAKDLEQIVDENSLNVPERDRLQELFTRLQPVFEIAQVLEKAGNPLTREGLRIRVDEVVEPERRTRQITENRGFMRGSETRSEEYQLPGVKSIIVTIGQTKHTALSGGNAKEVGYDGFSPVHVLVTKSVSGLQMDREYEKQWDGHWALLIEAVRGGRERFEIPGSEVGFSLESEPRLPFSNWPNRSDFVKDK
jgi:hypothetical protein